MGAHLNTKGTRMMQQAIRRIAKAPKAFEPTPNVEAFSKLNDQRYGPSEWYLYFYLCGIANVHGCNPFRTSIKQLRHPWTFEGVTVQPMRVAINTLKSAMAILEENGLISVFRTKEGVTIHLDITIN